MKASGGSRLDRRLLMLGFGVSGKAVCEFAVKHSIPIYVSEHDTLSQGQQDWLRERGIPSEQSGHTAQFFGYVDTVVLSPGIPADLPLLRQAREQGLAVISEIDLALRLVGTRPLIAVTGTNGKTSTVEVIAKSLQTQGCHVRVAGNIGIPLISLVDELAESDVLVLEVSSYQLEQSSGFHPNIGLLLTLSPDHLHRHKTMKEYAAAKGKMFDSQEREDVAIMPRSLSAQFNGGKGRRLFYDEVFKELPSGTESLLPHERANLRAALAACQALIPDLDISSIPMGEIVSSFRLPHRMETVGCVDNVTIINDSKSTNAGSAIAALHSVDQPVVLLLGGHSKGAGYDDLAGAIATRAIREVVLFGEAADELNKLFSHYSDSLPQVSVVQSMESAVDRGLRAAQPGDVLLLSPGCSSFDAFSDYAERGKAFVDRIQSRAGFESTASRT